MTDEELTKRFDTIDKRLDGFATKGDFERFATKADLDRFATKADLEQFATKADVERLPTKLDLDQIAASVRDHFNLIAESLKADIKVIAEGHRALRATDLELVAALKRLDKRQDGLELRQLALEISRRRPEDE